jgi:hypothetical protein
MIRNQDRVFAQIPKRIGKIKKSEGTVQFGFRILKQRKKAQAQAIDQRHCREERSLVGHGSGL